MLDLDPHQIEAELALAENRRFLLADEPGVGKTPPAIRAACRIGARSVLVLCPAIARENWRRELEVWQSPAQRWTVQVADPKRVPDADVVVASYNQLVAKTPFRTALFAREWDVLICDEAHFLKTPTSKRTRAVYGQHGTGPERGHGLAARSERVWLLTGTPTPNYVDELWPHLRALWPDLISQFDRPMRYAEFVDAFCVTRSNDYGRKVISNKKAPVQELRNRLRPYAMRRLYQKVYPDTLPPRLVSTAVEADLSKVAAELDETSRALCDEFLKVAKQGETAAVRWLQENLAAMSTVRRLNGVAKIKPTAEFIANALDNGTQKIVLCAHHRDVVSGLVEQLRRYGSVEISGSTSPSARQAAIDSFQNNKQTRVLVGQITAMSTAITLTAAHTIVFAEPSWVPAENRQAIGRCHRRGQTRRVQAHFLLVPESIDDRIVSALRAKTAGIRTLWDEQPTTQEKDHV